MSSIIVVTGTGTGVGKTHIASALIRAFRNRAVDAVGWKPVETGVAAGAEGPDEQLLREAAGLGESAATTVRLPDPLAPNIAARLHGSQMSAAGWVDTIRRLVGSAEVLVIELAGGLCSPLDDRWDNVDWLASWPQDLRDQMQLLLVACDRLGVLHDVSAARRAALGAGLALWAVVLSPPERPDGAELYNHSELLARGIARCVRVPRGSINELAASPALRELIDDP